MRGGGEGMRADNAMLVLLEKVKLSEYFLWMARIMLNSATNLYDLEPSM